MQSSQNLKRVVERAGELPAVPEIVAEVLRVTQDPSSDLNTVGDVVERDPALTAKILRISNSAYYGLKQHVGTLKLALVVLGITEVRNIVLGVSVFDAVQDQSINPTMARDVYGHCLVTGALAKKLFTRLSLNSHGEAFVSGVLHDIGKLLLVRKIKDGYIKLLKVTEGEPEALCRIEKEAFGFTHADAAAAVAELWDFPKPLTDALWLHHPIPESSLVDAKDPILAAGVRVANLAAHVDWQNLEEGTPLPHEQEDEAWSLLDTAPDPVSSTERTALFAEFAEEIASSPMPPM
ncbi:MAG: HDOD domain-containing protein [bacterium]|nr:HDOD domain-containing protein [bacterium]